MVWIPNAPKADDVAHQYVTFRLGEKEREMLKDVLFPIDAVLRDPAKISAIALAVVGTAVTGYELYLLTLEVWAWVKAIEFGDGILPDAGGGGFLGRAGGAVQSVARSGFLGVAGQALSAASAADPDRASETIENLRGLFS